MQIVLVQALASGDKMDWVVQKAVELGVSAIQPVQAERSVLRLKDGENQVLAGLINDEDRRTAYKVPGLGEVPLVASTLRPLWGGWVSEQHCLGENKIPMLAARGFAPPWAMAYTDHHADLPLLRHSAQWCLVSPTPDCLQRIETALATRAQVLAWRG